MSVVTFAREMGIVTEKNLDDSYYDMCVVYFGRCDPAFLYPQNMLQWADSLQARDPLGKIDKVDYLVSCESRSEKIQSVKSVEHFLNIL